MLETVENVIRLANGLVTISFFPFLFQIYRRTRRRFYLLWGVGFLLYGINIFVRIGIPYIRKGFPTPPLWFSFLFFMGAFILIITGIGDLIEKAKIMLASAICLPFITVIVVVFSGPYAVGWFTTLSPFLLIILSLIFIRRKYAATVDLFIMGWLLMFLANASIPLNMINPIYVEVLVIFGKVVIFIGMISPRFSLMVDELKRFLISGLPDVYQDETLVHFTLLRPKTGQKAQEIEWIIKKVSENSMIGVRTLLIPLYDLISPLELKSMGLDERKLYVVRMLTGGGSFTQVFKDRVMTINDDITNLDILFTELIRYCTERRIRCDIILYTLSWIIHTHGWKRIYSFLISKISDLKASSIHCYSFYYPETHDLAEISKFTKIADRIISI